MKTNGIKSPQKLLGLSVAFLASLASTQAASISGSVFFDLNGNGTRDTVSEYGLPSWSIRLDPVAPVGPAVFATTDESGRFVFDSLAAGDYTLAAVNPSPWLQTYPSGLGSHSISMAGSDTVTGKDFGCKQPVFVPQIEWQKSFGGVGYDGAARTLQTADGGYIIGGSSTSIASGVKTSPNFGGWDYWVVRLDAAGNQLWDHTFGGVGYDRLNSIKQTADGGFILAGVSDSPPGGNKTSPHYGGTDYWIVRLDPSGNKLWDCALGGTGDEVMRADSILELRNGGFLVVGASDSEISASSAEGNKTAARFGDLDGWLVWLDANGNKVRDLAYGGANLDLTCSALENPDGTIFVGGTSRSEPASGSSGTKTSLYYGGVVDYWLFKIDALGNVLWDKSFGGAGWDACDGFIALPDGKLLLTGYSYGSGISGNKSSPDQGIDNFWIVKVDADGNKVWDKTYGGDDWNEMTTATVTADGNLLLAGGSGSGISGNKVSPPFGNWNSWVTLVDPAGNHLWDQEFGSVNDDEDCMATATRDGGAIITRYTAFVGGNVTGPLYGRYDISLIKLAPFSCTANPFTLVSATADCGQGKITLNFSAPINPAAALDTTHYSVSGGAVSVQAVNFGASTLSVILDVSGLSPGVTYTLSANGLADDCGNVIAPNAQLTLACPGQIRGKVFSDHRQQNCLQGPGEFTLANWPVKLDPGPKYTLTDAAGNYLFTVPSGDYTVGALPSPVPNWLQVCPAAPGTYALTVTNGQIAAEKDFALRPEGTNCPDLWIDLSATYPGLKLYHYVGNNSPCCGATFIYHLRYGNQGNVPAITPTISFTYPPAQLCSLVNMNASCPPVTLGFVWGTGLQTFTLPTLNPGDQCNIDLKFRLCCNGNTPCQNQVRVDTSATIASADVDCDLANNRSDQTVVPCCSSDPNDCTVTPKGCGPDGLINRDQALTFLVQFQNLGGGAAHVVIVRNVLDDDLDLGTLEILGSSHKNLLQRNGRELTWIFPDIELASVSVDEEASHGYVKFRVRPRADAPVGAVINNSAEITFDVNEPMTTITTTNTITEAPQPKAAFQVVPQPGYAGTLSDFLYTGGTPGVDCLWDFGPDATPQTSTETNPTGIVFNQPGQHLVSLRVRLGDCESEPAVRLVTVGRPQLSIARAAGGPALTWIGDGYRLQETGDLTPPIQWNLVPAIPTPIAGWYVLRLPDPGDPRFYRLVQAP